MSGPEKCSLEVEKDTKTGGRIFRFHFIEPIPRNGCIWTGFPVPGMVGLIAMLACLFFWRGLPMTDMDGLFPNEEGSLSYRKQLGWQPKNMVGTPNSRWMAQTQYGWQMKNMDGSLNKEWIPIAKYGWKENKYVFWFRRKCCEIPFLKTL